MTRLLLALQRIEDGPAGPVLELLTVCLMFGLAVWGIPLFAVVFGVLP